jgi:ribosomal protein L3
MGAKQSTVKNLRVLNIETDKNLLVVGGGVPGNNGSMLIIRQA